MAGKSVGGNSLSLLLGDYNSEDSENDDNDNASNQLNDKLQEFLSDLNTTVTTNWTQCIDQGTGHPYYWNTLTKDVTWEMPAEYEKFLQQSLRSKNSNKENSYTVCYTDENVPYYVNEHTRQVSWEKPAGFVEPKAKVKENANKLKKSSKKTDRNGHKKKSTKRQDKSSKKYPFDTNDDLDHVKIEVISSFTTKSDSSSEDESKSKKAKTNFNLVANDYNSDENSDNESKTATKPVLFASHSSTNSIDPSTVKIYSLKTDLPTVKSSPADEIESTVPEKPTITKSKANTFASIITGGRNSPSDQDNELIELMKLEVTEVQPPTNSPVPCIDKPTEIDVKSFKRKRRIEFMTRPVAPLVNRSPENRDDANNSVPVGTSDAESPNADATNTVDASSTKPMYSNFVRSGAEPSPGLSDQTNCDKVPVADSAITEELNKQKTEIIELREIIESKLKFLCNGRPDVSAVQAIFIQFETLLEAYDSQALQPAYMQRWLDGISSDLSTLENDAAPAGWKCLWNRKKSQYCYKNLTTGEIRWEYPENDNKSDEMDICTTPPPNVDEQLKLEQSENQKLNCENGDDNSKPKFDEDGLPIPPPPPHISFVDDEPPPPGTDIDRNRDKPSERINFELASFYSEMATIDTDSMPATSEQPTSSSSTEAAKIPIENATVDALLKKKKKKVKKSEPWRSGNLETWINKWQKAQKELDG
ncbi:formin-binding protein 4-like [Bradysia coprophila]|uniref:formin-binding protein 4-like n=1 Tax=Bradysia coprophila TaxID=38358 RepID=UPI00187D79FD|nr:formin-binding protein 4-like [Bradysia coprophila]